MRILAILATLLLCACATKPGESVLYYKGVYAPGSVQIADDGAFISRASVWNETKWNLAGEAALYRLEQLARERGYSHFVLDGTHKEQTLGHQYVLNGTVYMRENAPFGALPIDQLRYASLDGETTEPVVAAVAQPAHNVRPQPVNVAPAPQGIIEDELPPGEEPMVIEAPEFVTMKPTKRPWG